ncbi:MAG: hypothetical protein ACOYEL_03460 [Saccharofermentanales bacterium]
MSQNDLIKLGILLSERSINKTKINYITWGDMDSKYTTVIL